VTALSRRLIPARRQSGAATSFLIRRWTLDIERWTFSPLPNEALSHYRRQPRCRPRHRREGRRCTLHALTSRPRRRRFGRDWSGYCMSKFALEGFSQAVREELRPRGIRVLNIYPPRRAPRSGRGSKTIGRVTKCCNRRGSARRLPMRYRDRVKSLSRILRCRTSAARSDFAGLSAFESRLQRSHVLSVF
jgi:NAD(P)-dependent dehydrogenase (short-subunit alcohol dehydrogenase family)